MLQLPCDLICRVLFGCLSQFFPTLQEIYADKSSIFFNLKNLKYLNLHKFFEIEFSGPGPNSLSNLIVFITHKIKDQIGCTRICKLRAFVCNFCCFLWSNDYGFFVAILAIKV